MTLLHKITNHLELIKGARYFADKLSLQWDVAAQTDRHFLCASLPAGGTAAHITARTCTVVFLWLRVLRDC